jgi:hypothetical protein
MGHIQARISLQTGLAMVLNTASNTGITSDTTSGIRDNEVVHSALFPPSLESLLPHPQAGHMERTFPISFTSSKRREYSDSQANHKLHKKANVLFSGGTAYDLSHGLF